MDKQCITSVDAPSAIGPYSQAIRHGDLLWCSGQLGIKPSTTALASSVGKQCEQALINLEAVCREANTSLDRALRCTIYLTTMDDFSEVNEAYARFFTEPFPTRACVAVASLPKDALVEIDAVVAMP